MPVELPNDVWFYIVKNCIDVEEGKSELKNLALSNKRIHEVAVPMLYKSLVFSPSSGSNYFLRTSHHPMQLIHRGRDRALSLRNCPHLLYYVRRFRFYGWSNIIRTREEVLESESYNSESEGEEIEYEQDEVLSNLWSMVYDIITSLVLEMPRLKTLTILESPITPRLHSTFSRIPTLKRIYMRHCKVPDARMEAGLLDVSYPIDIKELIYHWMVPDTLPDLYFQHLLGCCLPFLTSLKTDGVDLSLISEVVGNRRLLLRTLEMSFFFTDEDKPGEACDLCAFLMSCPDLRVIRLEDDQDIDMGEFQGGLPHLESVSSSPNVVRQLASGRPVHKVEFPCTVDEAGPADFETFWSPSVPIRLVYVDHLGPGCPSGEAVIKSLVRAFPQVTHITITVTYVTMELAVLASLTGGLSHSDLLFQELQEMMIENFAQWPELRYCRLISLHSIDLDESITKELAECPIAPRGDPNVRGHPTLEEVQLCSRFTWNWIPREGWLPESYEIRYSI